MKKTLIAFAMALGLSVIFAAGWAAGSGKAQAAYEAPVTVQAQEPQNSPDEKTLLSSPDEEDEDDFHLKIPSPPRFKFHRIVLPGIIPKP